MYRRKYSTRYPGTVLLFLLLYKLSAVCWGEVRVTSLAHDFALLPCRFDFIRGWEGLLLIWEKVATNGKKAQVYKSVSGRSDLSDQDPEFAGRTALSGDIAQGSLDLNLTVVTMNDGGAYYCRAANKINHGDNVVDLSVRAPPPEKIEKAAEDDVTLVAKYFGDPKEITWKVDNRKIVELEPMSRAPYFYYLSERAHINPAGHLTIKNLVKEDSGLYKSEVLVIDIIQETEIWLSVIDRVSKPVIYVNRTSQQIRLTCNSSSASNVTYQWKDKRSGDLVSTEQQYIVPKQTEDVELICTVSDARSADSETITISEAPEMGRHHFIVLPPVVLVALVVGAVGCYRKQCFRKEV